MQSVASVSLTGTWQSLGAGPFDVQVLAGSAVLQSADRRPSNNDGTGLILAAAVGTDPTHCGGPGEWWAKALLGGAATIAVLPTAAAVPATPGTGAVSVAAEAIGVAGVDLSPALIVRVAPDGTLRPASSSDPAQSGAVAGFTTAGAASGGAATFTRTDLLTSSAWSLKPGPVFVGENGAVTQTEPSTGFVQVAGLALSAKTILAVFGPPTLVGSAIDTLETLRAAVSSKIGTDDLAAALAPVLARESLDIASLTTAIAAQIDPTELAAALAPLITKESADVAALTAAIAAQIDPGELAASLAPIIAKETLDVAALSAALAAQLDTYRYGKALNAALPGLAPSANDAMIAFTQANNSPGSTAMRAATANIPAPPGGDYETLVLAPWLATLTSPPTIAQLRAAALALTY